MSRGKWDPVDPDQAEKLISQQSPYRVTRKGKKFVVQRKKTKVILPGEYTTEVDARNAIQDLTK